MKIEFDEYDLAFSMILTPETLEDASKLVRFGLNATKEYTYWGIHADRKTGIGGFITFRKRKQGLTSVKP